MQIISRSESKLQNLIRYFTGVPCKYGHIAERKTKNADCLTCKNNRMRSKRSTPEQKIKDAQYRSTVEYKTRKNTRNKFRSGAFVKLVQKEIDRRENKRRAGVKFISKNEAIEYGLYRYFDGLVCKRGHMSERSVANGQCSECSIMMNRSHDRVSRKAKYYEANKDTLMRQNVKRQRERYAESPEYKASTAARNMLKRVLRAAKTKKHGGSYEMLGYTRDQLMTHLSDQFTDGMTWLNYGEWHIDHIVPVSWWLKNDVTDPSMINALINLQPLWAQDNFDKRDKL